MNTKHPLFGQADDKTVYVRPVDVDGLPEELQDQAEGADQIYAVHSSDGKCLALVKDEEMAFFLARQHEFAPVHVH